MSVTDYQSPLGGFVVETFQDRIDAAIGLAAVSSGLRGGRVTDEIEAGAFAFEDAIASMERSMQRQGIVRGGIDLDEHDTSVWELKAVVGKAMQRLDREEREGLVFWLLGQVLTRNTSERESAGSVVASC